MKRLLSFIMAAQVAMVAVAQDAQPERRLTKEAVMAMTIDQLGDLSFEDLLLAVDLLEVNSVDELYAIIMNKSVASASKSVESALSKDVALSE